MNHFRYLGAVLMCAAFSLGLARVLRDGILTGTFHGRKGARLLFDSSPVLFVAAAVLCLLACLGFTLLTWTIYRNGPAWLEESREDDRARRRARRARAPGTVGLLLRGGIAAAAIGIGVPFHADLAVLIGKPFANAIFGLWALAFGLWMLINLWRWLGREKYRT